MAAKSKDRWDFRVAPGTDELVRQAAETAGQTLTEFVVDAVTAEADRILADRSSFVLARKQWNELVSLLDRSPREKPELEQLFSTPSVFTSH